ncbi:MAG: hypothetical protein K1000chlam4_00017 [Chlamydiae bacterium]|nr:hypothetical protein [Chlamydiota bacterium]
MRWIFFTLLFCIPTLHAERIDPTLSSFEQREKKHVDLFDFSGEYENLEDIDIDARRKKRVEVLLTGTYPVLESINYEGNFGSLTGKLSGSFPKLSLVNFLCKSAIMKLDLTGKWEHDCELNIRATAGDILLTIPTDVGVIIHTKRLPIGKVIVNDLTKKGLGWTKKTFINELYEESPVTLTLNLEVSKGRIIIN